MATEGAILQGIFLAGFAATFGAGGQLGEMLLALFGSRTAGLPGKGEDGEAFLRAAWGQRPSLSAPLIAVAYLVSAVRMGLILIRCKDKGLRAPRARQPRFCLALATVPWFSAPGRGQAG